jgi:hypothetical protein
MRLPMLGAGIAESGNENEGARHGRAYSAATAVTPALAILFWM